MHSSKFVQVRGRLRELVLTIMSLLEIHSEVTKLLPTESESLKKYVSVWVCVSVCMWVHVSVWMWMCACGCMWMCAYDCMWVHVSVCIWMCACGGRSIKLQGACAVGSCEPPDMALFQEQYPNYWAISAATWNISFMSLLLLAFCYYDWTT